MVENQDFNQDFELKFVGRIDDKIAEKFENSLWKHHIKNLGYLSHQESLVEMQNSNLLLITNFPKEESKGIIPGKLFEYLATGKQILSFGPKNADVENIILETKTGKHFDFQTDPFVLKSYLLSEYKIWKQDSHREIKSNIHAYSRKYLTKKLVEILENK
jgi:glycosyltransferase involved in cell wall biosynthesis